MKSGLSGPIITLSIIQSLYMNNTTNAITMEINDLTIVPLKTSRWSIKDISEFSSVLNLSNIAM